MYHFLQPSPLLPQTSKLPAAHCLAVVCLSVPGPQVSFHRKGPVGNLTSQAPPKQNTIQLRNGISLCSSPQQPFTFPNHQSQCAPPSARPVPAPHQPSPTGLDLRSFHFPTYKPPSVDQKHLSREHSRVIPQEDPGKSGLHVLLLNLTEKFLTRRHTDHLALCFSVCCL